MIYFYVLMNILWTIIVGVSTPGGSLDRRVKLSLRVPAQMGWREMEHKGGKRGSCYPAPGDALIVGVTSVREGERVSLFVSPSSRATLSHEGSGPSFYRCKERVQVYNGGVAYALTCSAERCLSPVYMPTSLSERC
jgi:hypothetical protein